MDYPAALRGVGAQSTNPASGIDGPPSPPLPRRQPIAQLRIAITALHEAILLEPEAADKAVMATCLTNLIKLQAKNQQEQGQNTR
jgi:hypothetical protein